MSPLPVVRAFCGDITAEHPLSASLRRRRDGARAGGEAGQGASETDGGGANSAPTRQSDLTLATTPRDVTVP